MDGGSETKLAFTAFVSDGLVTRQQKASLQRQTHFRNLCTFLIRESSIVLAVISNPSGKSSKGAGVMGGVAERAFTIQTRRQELESSTQLSGTLDLLCIKNELTRCLRIRYIWSSFEDTMESSCRSRAGSRGSPLEHFWLGLLGLSQNMKQSNFGMGIDNQAKE